MLWVGAEFAACSGLCWLKSLLTHVENSHFVLASHRCCLISEPRLALEAQWSFLAAGYNISQQLRCSLQSKHYVYWNKQKKVIGFLPCREAEIGWLSGVKHTVMYYSYLKCFVLCCLSEGGGGNFLYIHSATQREGDVAKVTTRSPFPASIGLCHLRFWFFMHGSDKMGTLKVISSEPHFHK